MPIKLESITGHILLGVSFIVGVTVYVNTDHNSIGSVATALSETKIEIKQQLKDQNADIKQQLKDMNKAITDNIAAIPDVRAIQNSQTASINTIAQDLKEAKRDIRAIEKRVDTLELVKKVEYPKHPIDRKD